MKKNLVLTIVCFACIHAFSQTGDYWKQTTDAALLQATKGKDVFAGRFKPSAYKLFNLNEAAFKAVLSSAPSEKNVSASNSPLIVSVPNAEGQTENFRLVEAPVMEAALAAKYPLIKSYTGKGIDNPSATLRCDMTPEGFHGTIFSAGRKTIYINPVDKNSKTYAVYAREERESKFRCELGEIITGKPQAAIAPEGNADDNMLRTYRLALVTTGEFSQHFLDGTETSDEERKAKVMANITAELTRANGIYERDFDVRMVFVAEEDTIIFLNPGSDPYHGEYNNTTQKTCDKYIGKNNYDIGHVLHKAGDNGNAGCIGCVCENGEKGSGFTMYQNPDLLDYLVVDYWTHEMGHQFGANHTFTFYSEGTNAQIEPGSGSTIMGYAGITGSTDVQPHSDDYFSTASIAQITNYIKNPTQGGECPVITATGNHTPSADAGADYTIPILTPFVLTGQAMDSDITDIYTFCWEQIDVLAPGSNTFPRPNSKTGPVFRSLNYTAEPYRYFPKLQTVLDGLLKTKWEALPSVSRDLNFRLTVRDNHEGGGSNESDETIITVSNKAGPFEITDPNSGDTLHANDLKTITWSVANTDAAPVNCTNVDILLSIDGGITFPFTLAATTPNDGSEEIAIPAILTEHARIKVQSVGNIFFDISDKDFVIDEALPVTWLSFTAEKSGNAVLLKWSTANEINNDHYEIERSTNGVDFTLNGIVNGGSQPNQAQHYSYYDLKPLAGKNFYRLKQVDKDGKFDYSQVAEVTIEASLWSVFPNPATSKTTIRPMAQLSDVIITMVNADGKVVYNRSISAVAGGEDIEIPVSNLKKGVYVLKVQSDKGSRTEKIVVQ